MLQLGNKKKKWPLQEKNNSKIWKLEKVHLHENPGFFKQVLEEVFWAIYEIFKVTP